MLPYCRHRLRGAILLRIDGSLTMFSKSILRRCRRWIVWNAYLMHVVSSGSHGTQIRKKLALYLVVALDVWNSRSRRRRGSAYHQTIRRSGRCRPFSKGCHSTSRSRTRDFTVVRYPFWAEAISVVSKSCVVLPAREIGLPLERLYLRCCQRRANSKRGRRFALCRNRTVSIQERGYRPNVLPRVVTLCSLRTGARMPIRERRLMRAIKKAERTCRMREH